MYIQIQFLQEYAGEYPLSKATNPFMGDYSKYIWPIIFNLCIIDAKRTNPDYVFIV